MWLRCFQSDHLAAESSAGGDYSVSNDAPIERWRLINCAVINLYLRKNFKRKEKNVRYPIRRTIEISIRFFVHLSIMVPSTKMTKEEFLRGKLMCGWVVSAAYNILSFKPSLTALFNILGDKS